ncbi:MAG: efflux RND transporter permease subunit [Deltaproteobacteria bacterium]|nr:efflux RND transporter permease subunit [Deltaproteobacteria bacterium]
MIGKLIEASARNRVLVLFLAAALAVCGWGAVRSVKLDAIPDLSDPQVIVFTEWMGRSPTLVEDQVTYPLVTALLGAPHVVDVRGQTMFGMSFVYVVFEEGTDLYWARSRVLEYLNTVRNRLPPEATSRIGPDATGIGWVYQYALVDRSGRHDLGQLRALQDFSLRYALTSVPGVAEVASVGGFEQQYQVTVDPVRLRNFGLTIGDVARAVRRSNADVGGRVVEMSQREYFVRGRGYITRAEDLEAVVIRAGGGGTPVLVRDVAGVRVGGEIRRGAADLDGQGEAVSGIVVMRYGENALDVIRRVERKLEALRPSLPPGVELVTVYSRAGLIERAIDTLRHALREEMIVVSLVIILFLLHLRSALLPIVSIPLAVLVAFIPMYLLGIPATIMSLGGIAIAIGATVDAEIVMVEAAHKKLEGAPPDLPPAERERLLAEAAREVTPAIFFSLLIIAASFIPVFGLTGQAGRLFRPLAYTKTFVMLSAALLSVTVAPALRDYLIRGKIYSEARHPVSRLIRAFYEPFVYVALRNPRTTVLIGLMALLSALPVAQRLGSEFMPPLDEGDLVYMPTTLPNISIEEARRQLQHQDAILRDFPEVERVLGKVGRAETPTDPAPLSMVETVVKLRPREQWRTRYVRRWYVGRTPQFMRPLLARLQPEFVRITREELTREMNQRMQMPGWTNAFTQPIRNRVDMLATGIRTPIGVKVYGTDLEAIERTGVALERVLHAVPGTRSVLFERSVGGLYVDIVPNREALARHGLQIQDVNDVVESALGGVPVTTTVEGRNRFTVNVRYAEDFRSSVQRMREVLVPLPAPGEAMEDAAPGGAMGGGAAPPPTTGGARQIELGAVADVRIVAGPPMIRDEAGMLVGYVYVDTDASRDVGRYVEDARRAVDAAIRRGEVRLGQGSYLHWTGQYELLAQMEERMKVLIPAALLIIVVLLYLQFKNFTEVLIVLLSVPFALVGSVWALYLLGYNLSTAVWVGVIALVGLAAQTGVVMIVYIDHAYERRLAAGQINTLEDIIHAHSEGTVQRVRPKLMTVSTMLFGLVPLLWAEGSGADVMKRIAAPMVGGLITSAFLTLEIIPVIYTYWRAEQLLWRRVGETVPRRLPALRGLERLIMAGLAVALAALVARLYFAHPPPALWTATAAGAATGALALVGYAVMRRGARLALDRAAATHRDGQDAPDPPAVAKGDENET